MTLGVAENRTVTAMVTTDQEATTLNGTILIYSDHPQSAETVLGYELHLIPSAHSKNSGQ